MRITVIVLAIGLLFFSSCEDIIEINLNDAGPRIVIEGVVVSHASVQQVKISRTVALTNEGNDNPVSNAIVRVSDNHGNTYHFVEEQPGLYLARNFRGIRSHTYYLYIQVDDNEYTAASTMPVPVPTDSVRTSISTFFGQTTRAIHVYFQDPPDESNYFRYLLEVNNNQPVYTALFDDKYNNGRYVTHDLLDFDVSFSAGDEVTIHQHQMDAEVFKYWNSLEAINPGTASPANPDGNISNGALGYFSAHSVSRMTIRIPPDE